MLNLECNNSSLIAGCKCGNNVLLISKNMLVYSTNRKIMGNIYNSPYRKIRRFLRVGNALGYSFEIENRHSGSCYICVSKINGNTSCFILRFSDHNLGKYNQVPAGVIDSYCTFKNCIRCLQKAISLYERLSPIEIEKLWTNRILQEEYCFLNRTTKY